MLPQSCSDLMNQTSAMLFTGKNQNKISKKKKTIDLSYLFLDAVLTSPWKFLFEIYSQ